MPIRFRKMHAHGDDFIVLDRRGVCNLMSPDLARRLGDRRRGIGCNQLVVITDCPDAMAQLTFWNADGTQLAACGSATRGVARLLMEETGMDRLSLRTPRGLLACERVSDDRICVDMEEPLLDWRDVPLARELDTLMLPIEGSATATGMGNPHCTFFVANLAEVDPAQAGPRWERHPLFPQGTNVHFVQVIDRGRIRLRIWERGGGVPQGSGSCACAAAVAAIRRGLTDNTVEVVCDGGAVSVQWTGVGGVKLTGPVTHVFDGEFQHTGPVDQAPNDNVASQNMSGHSA